MPARRCCTRRCPCDCGHNRCTSQSGVVDKSHSPLQRRDCQGQRKGAAAAAVDVTASTAAQQSLRRLVHQLVSKKQLK